MRANDNTQAITQVLFLVDFMLYSPNNNQYGIYIHPVKMLPRYQGAFQHFSVSSKVNAEGKKLDSAGIYLLDGESKEKVDNC